MRIAVIGQGAREHVLAWKLRKSPHVDKVWVIPGNAGTQIFNIDHVSTHQQIIEFCQQNKVHLVVIGPEQALANGLADDLRASQQDPQFAVFGPGQSAARLESSKIWARHFSRRHGVAIPDYTVCQGLTELRQTARAQGSGIVLKYDGLAAGKGSFVCSNPDSLDENLHIIEQRFDKNSSWLVEQALSGRELSQMVLFDGKRFQLLPSAQDYKPVFDKDLGPNTGGMGALSPVPDLDSSTQQAIVEQIIEPSLRGLQDEAIDYRGLIYFGVMLTAHGPKLLEYNVRFGDPESQVILPRLDEDFAELLYGCAKAKLESRTLRVNAQHFVSLVMSSAGYPGEYQTGEIITGLDKLDAETLVFHAGTRINEQGLLHSAGGRVLNLVCAGTNLEQARLCAYSEIEKVHFKGMHFRSDIGRIKNAACRSLHHKIISKISISP